MKNILFLIALFPVILFGQLRADQLPEITDPAGTDAFYSAERGSFQKITIARLQTYLGAASALLLPTRSQRARKLPCVSNTPERQRQR